ncbi:MAG: glycosyltransferase, partial [Chloroflexi bacterium]|nr:glycosyltransferase [Chloroflexota bacterium]
MKIGMLVDTYLPLVGGAEVHVVELGRALSNQGCEVAICTAMPGRDEGGLPLLRLPQLKDGGWRAFLRIPLALPALLRYLRSVDVVHCHYSFLLAA